MLFEIHKVINKNPKNIHAPFQILQSIGSFRRRKEDDWERVSFNFIHLIFWLLSHNSFNGIVLRVMRSQIPKLQITRSCMKSYISLPYGLPTQHVLYGPCAIKTQPINQPYGLISVQGSFQLTLYTVADSRSITQINPRIQIANCMRRMHWDKTNFHI